ncbi:DUF262 domain-containing protein [Sphingobium sp. BS19]|uniref:DUF262 domain-containing protein n=1 Tax=Sphingobium sp. BS19 TaxID=3018973 RepID=UPI0024935A2B|nr:DUF262 domain-containing protein [Sphingobium sp. BS19]
MLNRRELVVNAGYQRGSGIWPEGPSSYFIDTILSGFPFPKIYLYEFMDRPSRSPTKEIVDGQQRIGTIQRFVNNEFAIRGESKYAGLKFDDLDLDMQDSFMSYTIAADVIRNARPAEILQMFRRMNAYTLPLNSAEKRHSSYQGSFKWSVNGMTDHFNEFFQEYGVFTPRQIVRMSDAELVSDCVLAIEEGIVSTSDKALSGLYQRYDEDYPEIDTHRRYIVSAVEYIIAEFGKLRGTHMMKPYALHSLITAMIHAKYGIPPIAEMTQTHSIGNFAANPSSAAERLLTLAQAHEAKELEGPFGKYVWGASAGTNRINRRLARVSAILRALGVNVPSAVDANIS